MSEPLDRRRFVGVVAAGASLAATAEAGRAEAAPPPRPAPCAAEPDPEPEEEANGRLLTPAGEFRDVSRGNPKPHTLKGKALADAGLTPETWRLEVVADPSARVAKPRSIEKGNAVDLPALVDMAKAHGIAYLKTTQCNNIATPLGQGVWEGVPLREIVRTLGRIDNVRRVYYWGFHNNDPKQIFQSSLCFNRVMETPPWEPPAIVAHRLNGEPIPLERGGPVRLIVPWAHGFKSIKWLRRIVLTNDYQANDTYALQNNDPDSYLKTAAYLPKGRTEFKAGTPVAIRGTTVVGPSGLARVEYWIRPATGLDGDLPDGDPAWRTADWRPCELAPPPDDWSAVLPAGVDPAKVWGFDPVSKRPKAWPLIYGSVPWTATIADLPPGKYEFRARTVDLNGFAQPEPRTYQKSGMNRIQTRLFAVVA